MPSYARVLVYAPPTVQCMSFAEAIRQVATVEVMELFRTASDVCKAAAGADYHRDCLVLMPETLSDLEALSEMGDVLSRSRIIIVLPGQSETMIELGHKLHPRFLTYANEPTEELKSVVEKMTALVER